MDNLNPKSLHTAAHEAGLAALEACTPVPMVVAQHANPLDDNSAVEAAYYVPEGPCGFAWIHIKGNTAFGRWAKKHEIARKAYHGGLHIWVREGGQSIARKEAYATAYAKVLRDAGLSAYMDSRLD